MNMLYAFLLLLAAPLLFAAARFFKHAELEALPWLRTTIGAGAVAGTLAALAVTFTALPRALTLSILLAAGVIWAVSRIDVDRIDGAMSGSLVAIGFALPLALGFRGILPDLAVLLVAGPVAGALAAARPSRIAHRFTIAALTVTGAAAGTAGAQAVLPFIDPATLATAAVVTTALAAAAAPLVRWRAVLEELEEEARIGVLDPALVARIAHPFRRILAAPGDPDARKKITRLSWTLALRKRRQRRLGETEARLQHLEILKLRGELAAVQGIAREIALLERTGDDASDRIIAKG